MNRRNRLILLTACLLSTIDMQAQTLSECNFFSWKHYKKEEPLLEAGLLGPVRWVVEE